MAIEQRYCAFWSYTRFDDKNDELWVTALRKALIDEVRALFGKQIEIFQDIDGIAWGEQWKEKLGSSSDNAVFLIPIITPSYFASEPCRLELRQFVDREKALGFKEFILPLYYIETPKLRDKFEMAADFLAQTVADHKYEDIRDLRHHEISSYEVKQQIKKLATALVGRLTGYARKQLSSHAMRVQFTAPADGAKAPRRALLSGTVGNIPAGIDVWLVVETGTVYHPQRQLSTGNGGFQEPVIIGLNTSENQGQPFTVHALAVTEDVSETFDR